MILSLPAFWESAMDWTLAYLVVPALLVFAFSTALRRYCIRRICKHYSDGSGSFVFDELPEKKSCSLNLIGRTDRKQE